MKRVVVAAALAAAAVPGVARAAPPWVDRHVTLPRHDWAFDLGLGVQHAPPRPSRTGFGFNFEMAVGVVEKLELGLRTGVRSSEAALRPDAYGRLFDRQTFDTAADPVANPELRVRGALVKQGPAEVALEGRLVAPFAEGSRVGTTFGVPLLFHAGRSVRLDTGAFVPVVYFADPVWALSVPLDVWIQASPKVALGPLTGVRFSRRTPGPSTDFDLQLGFGLTYAFAAIADFKALFYLPDVSEEVRQFGAGAGLQIRIE